MSKDAVDPAGIATFKALQKVARTAGKDVNAAASRLGVERLLHRVFTSRHADRFAVKGGALMMMSEGLGPLQGRSTADADLALPAFDGTMADFEAMMHEILSREHEDGVRFDLSTWQVRAEREEGALGGGSVTVRALIGQHKVGVKVDVTFDERTRLVDLEAVDYPTILGDSFRISRVPEAHACADKIQAMIRHGARTHRLRDHYDLYVMLTRGGVDPMAVAVQLPTSLACFSLALPETVDGIPALSDEEAVRRDRSWERERLTRGFGISTPPFREMNEALRGLVAPIIAAAQGLAFRDTGGEEADPTPGFAM